MLIFNKHRRVKIKGVELEKEIIDTDFMLYIDAIMNGRFSPGITEQNKINGLKKELEEFFNRNYSNTKVPNNQTYYPIAYKYFKQIKKLSDIEIIGNKHIEI